MSTSTRRRGEAKKRKEKKREEKRREEKRREEKRREERGEPRRFGDANGASTWNGKCKKTHMSQKVHAGLFLDSF
ncbi:MAG TPA: hypothetical protein VIM51_03215 [Desulfosporosinus sp.]